MGTLPPPLRVNPPLVNSSNPWATSLEDLRKLYECSSLGAVTTRTCLIGGFKSDPDQHRCVFFDPSSHQTSQETEHSRAGHTQNSSLNSLGYSPLPLETYLDFIKTISSESASTNRKPFIVSITGTPEEIGRSYIMIAAAQKAISSPLAMEVNLSCPNIPGSPPPAYSAESLWTYLKPLIWAVHANTHSPRIPFGLKTPPYTHATQFGNLMKALMLSCQGAPRGVCPVSFITATNTLGSCLVFSDEDKGAFAFPGLGTGGLGGSALHPLALGNVATIRRLLDDKGEALGHICIIGTGGVLDSHGYNRMRRVGAAVVGVGTGLGLKGVAIFGEIEKGLDGTW